MGRDAHKLRAVLGRGATQAPDWGALTEQRRYLRMSGEPERYLGNPHLRPFIFDAKGRPYSDANSRRELDELNDALNAVTGILNHNAEITSEEQRLKYEDAGEKYGEEVVSVHFPSAVHAMCLNVSAIMNLYIGTIRRRLLTFESPDTVLSMLPNKFGSHELQSLVSSGSSGLVFWFFVVKHGLLERSMAFVQYVPIDGSQIRPTSRPWQVTISKAAVLIR